MDHFLIVKDHQEWACRRFGSLENLFSSASKADVICMAAAQVGHLQSSVKIHGEDGSLEEERIYPLLSGDPLRYL
ncbi:DUF2188 domain-containing protein [Pseudomonas tohonis]|uniref:DUF2188 domain-containing protein n=1 Tax=Pseudomonas tohonis TaxID=2725477 RepID=UPI001F3F7E3F|nr:DUF2188 domain-containing protein [Pseudomonas tohonis]